MSDPAGGDDAVLRAGPPLEQARLAAVLVHGRGATAEDILTLAPALRTPDVAFVAPQARNGTWYPRTFLAPLRENEPDLSSGIARLASLVAEVETEGLPASRIALVGFSQGACLALEFAARHPRRYAAVIGLTGGLIGPPGIQWRNRGRLDGTPVFLGAGDPDPHVPWWRVEETAAFLTGLGADVTLRRYPGMPHSISPEELDEVRERLGPGESRS